MKKAASIMALIALVIALSLGVAQAHRSDRRTYYGPYSGGWTCPWMGNRAGGTAWNGAYSPWRGGSHRHRAGVGPCCYQRAGTSTPADSGLRATSW